MNTIDLHFFDAKTISIDSIKSLPFLHEDDYLTIDQYTSLLGKQEKAISLYFKRKYIGDFYTNDFGKPLSTKTFFNISHSNGFVIFAKTNLGPIGIDIERNKPVSELLIKTITTDEELATIHDPKDFFKIWTCKESLIKSRGINLPKNLKSIPTLPLNGIKSYDQQAYSSQIKEYSDYIIAVTIQSNVDFTINLISEEISL